jgi:hypothetical protein
MGECKIKLWSKNIGKLLILRWAKFSLWSNWHKPCLVDYLLGSRYRRSETYPQNIVIYALAGLEFNDLFHRLGFAAKFCAPFVVPGKLPGGSIDYLIIGNRAGNQSILSGRNI